MSRLNNNSLFLFLLPALLILVVFTLLPSLWAVYVSFTDLALAGPKALNYDFIGLRNYVELFNDRGFHNSLWLSIQYTIYTNLGQFVFWADCCAYAQPPQTAWPKLSLGGHRPADGHPRHHPSPHLVVHVWVRGTRYTQPYRRTLWHRAATLAACGTHVLDCVVNFWENALGFAMIFLLGRPRKHSEWSH